MNHKKGMGLFLTHDLTKKHTKIIHLIRKFFKKGSNSSKTLKNGLFWPILANYDLVKRYFCQKMVGYSLLTLTEPKKSHMKVL